MMHLHLTLGIQVPLPTLCPAVSLSVTFMSPSSVPSPGALYAATRATVTASHFAGYEQHTTVAVRLKTREHF